MRCSQILQADSRGFGTRMLSARVRPSLAHLRLASRAPLKLHKMVSNDSAVAVNALATTVSPLVSSKPYAPDVSNADDQQTVVPFRFRLLPASSPSADLAAPVVVMLPGLFAGSWIWDKSTAAVRAAGHSVLELENAICDYGKRITGLPELRTRLAATLDAAGIGVPERGSRVVLCGNSFGGLIAADFAAHFPERTAGVLISGAPGLGEPYKLELEGTKFTRAHADQIVASIFHNRQAITQEMINTCFKVMILPCNMINVMRCLRLSDQTDTAALLPLLECPVSLVWGQHDVVTPLTPWQEASHLFSNVPAPGAAVKIIAGSGHSPMIEQPDGFNAALLEFLGGASTWANGGSSNRQAKQAQLITRPRQTPIPSSDNSNWVVERLSGVQFPKSLPQGMGPSQQELSGVGVRTISLLGLKNIHIYCLGIYVDSAAFCELAVGHSAVDQTLLDALVASPAVGKTLAMVVMTRAMSKPRFMRIIGNTLSGRLKHVPNQSATLSEFEALFADVDFHPGTELAFQSRADGSTTVYVNGAAIGSVALPAFGSALFGLFLGRDVMSPSAKADVVKGLMALLPKVHVPQATTGPAQGMWTEVGPTLD